MTTDTCVSNRPRAANWRSQPVVPWRSNLSQWHWGVSVHLQLRCCCSLHGSWSCWQQNGSLFGAVLWTCLMQDGIERSVLESINQSINQSVNVSFNCPWWGNFCATRVGVTLHVIDPSINKSTNQGRLPKKSHINIAQTTGRAIYCTFKFQT